MRVGTRGQVVIPVQIRREAQIHEGDEVEFDYDGSSIRITRREGSESRGQRLVGRMRGTANARETTGMTTDDIVALLRDE